MTGRLISDDAAGAYFLRQWLAHDAMRTAWLICWDVYSYEEGLAEFRGLARLADARAKGLPCQHRAVAKQMLDEELSRQTFVHRQTEKDASAAAIATILEGGSKDDAAAAVARVAHAASLPPPPKIIVQAVEYMKFRLRQLRRQPA